LKSGLQGIQVEWHCSIVAGGGDVNHLSDFLCIYRTVVGVSLGVVESPYGVDLFTTVIVVKPMMMHTNAKMLGIKLLNDITVTVRW